MKKVFLNKELLTDGDYVLSCLDDSSIFPDERLELVGYLTIEGNTLSIWRVRYQESEPSENDPWLTTIYDANDNLTVEFGIPSSILAAFSNMLIGKVDNRTEIVLVGEKYFEPAAAVGYLA